MNLLPIITVRYNADGAMKKEKEKKQKKNWQIKTIPKQRRTDKRKIQLRTVKCEN